MEISKDIIMGGILKMEEHYGELEKLFAEKTIPECLQIKETLENLKDTKKFKVQKVYPDLVSKYEELKNYSDKTIYMFSVTKFPYDFNEMTKIKERVVKEKEISLCRINEASPGWKNVKKNKPVCLYVGSSEDIRQRLKEHLFLCNRDAYAMHLAEWFDSKDLFITIDTWNFHDFLEGKNHEFLQNIEDLLWEHYKPLFGRQGKK